MQGGARNNSFKVLKGGKKGYSSTVLFPVRMPFKHKVLIKTFSGKKKKATAE
jgi:hypothetical protein